MRHSRPPPRRAARAPAKAHVDLCLVKRCGEHRCFPAHRTTAPSIDGGRARRASRRRNYLARRSQPRAAFAASGPAPRFVRLRRGSRQHVAVDLKIPLERGRSHVALDASEAVSPELENRAARPVFRSLPSPWVASKLASFRARSPFPTAPGDQRATTRARLAKDPRFGDDALTDGGRREGDQYAARATDLPRIGKRRNAMSCAFRRVAPLVQSRRGSRRRLRKC